MTPKKDISSIKGLTVSFKTGLFLCKVNYLAQGCNCASECDLTKGYKLFKMVQKMQMYTVRRKLI